MIADQNNKKLKNGFTLIELLILVALISVLSVMSVAFYSRFLTQNSVANTVDQLSSSLRKAQMYSMSGKKGGVWGVAYSTSKIILFQGNTYATRDSSLDEAFSLNSNTAISGLTEITFAKVTGIPSATGTFTITGDNNTKTITVNAQGAVSK